MDVHLVSSAVTGGFADSTRKVERIGFLLVRVTTDQGLEAIGPGIAMLVDANN
jgi:hypothetical protein